MRLVFPYLFAISYSHSSNQSKRDSIGEDISILSKFMDKVDGVVNETVDEPFHKDLDAFVDGMQDLSITTYTTTNRIGATSTQTVYNSYSYGQTTTIEVPKKEANIEDLLSGDNFYGNELTDMYNEWKLANPDEKVSKSDFIVGSVHTRAFEYKSIKDEQQEKEFWVNIVSAVVIIGVGIFCPPAGLALGFAMGALEMSSAISGKDWVSGRELDTGERILRGGLSLLDIVPGVKALSSGARAVTTSTRLAGLADNVFTSGMKTATSKIDDVIRIGKSEVASRLGNLKTAANDAIQSAGKRLTTSIDEASEAVARFSDNISNALPKRQLAMEGAGALPAGSKAATSLSKASDEVRAVLSKIDTSLGGVAKKTDGIMNDVVTSGDEIISSGARYGDRRISDDLYKELRGETPTPQLRDRVNEGVSLPMADPAIPGKQVTSRLEADHIVSMDKITKMEGFEKLTREEQIALLNYEDNFAGLSKSANSSKGSKSFEEWTMYKKEGIPIDPAYRERMMGVEKELERRIQQLIDETLRGR